MGPNGDLRWYLLMCAELLAKRVGYDPNKKYSMEQMQEFAIQAIELNKARPPLRRAVLHTLLPCHVFRIHSHS